MEKRIGSLDYIRALVTIGIVIFHFFINGQNLINLPTSSNFSLGQICVSVFFVLSGYCLALTNNDKFDIKSFYFRRVKKYFLFIILHGCLVIYLRFGISKVWIKAYHFIGFI